jgi:catecholate siderophore receptor
MAHITSRKHPVAAQPRLNCGTALALAALALPATLYAQPAQPAAAGAETTLPEIKAHSAPPNPYKPEQASSPKYTAPLLDTPQTITVLPARVLEEQGRTSLVEALSTVPGITFGAGEGGGGYGDKINFRGYAADNSITVDGMRDSAQYSRSDAFNIDQIEVSNGANSVYGGAGNVSGSINLVSKLPQRRNFTRLGVGLGTDDYRRLTLDANRLLNDSTAVRLNLMAHGNDVPGRDVEKYERWGFAPSITFGLNTPTKVTLAYLHQRDDNIPQYGVPYYRNAFNGGVLPGAKSSNYYGYRDVDTQEIGVDMFTALFEHRFNDRFSVRNLTRAQHVTQLSRVDPPQGTWCLASGINVATGAACAPANLYTPSGPRGTTRDSVNNFIGNQTDFTFAFKTGAAAHTLVSGFSIAHESYRLVNGNSLRNPGGALPNPVLPAMSISNPAGVYGAPMHFDVTGKNNGELDNIAIYAFDNIQFTPKWSVNGGVRFEKNRGSSSTAAVAGGVQTWNPTASNSEDLTSYRLGLVYKPADNGTFYAVYGNAKTPSKSSVNGSCALTQTNDRTTGVPLGNANCGVAPETAVSVELGTKWDLLGNRLSLTAAIFRNELQNYKVNSGDPTVPDAQTDGQSRVDGIALGASGQITPRWGLFANYTHLKSKVLQSVSDIVLAQGGLDAQAGNPLTNTPEDAFSLWTTYQVMPALTLGYGATYQGSWYLNNGAGPLYKAPSYWVHNAMVAYRVNSRLDLQLNLKNLADKVYHTRIRNNGWATPGDGRAVTLAANYAF